MITHNHHQPNPQQTPSTSVDIDDFTQTDPTGPLAAVASYDYNPAGQPTQAALTGGVTRSWSYTDGQIGTYTQTGANPVTDTLAYDPLGRLASINTTQDTFSYDPMDQLLSETHGSTTISYTYDGDGRRKTRTQGASTLTYTYDDASQLTSIDNGTSFTYDAAGRRLTGSGPGFGDTFGYDTGGRLGTLTRVEGATTTSETRRYGPYGNLIGQTDTTGAAATNTRMDWDPTSTVPQLVANTMNTTTTDLIGVGSTDVTVTGGNTNSTGQDSFGSLTNTGVPSTLQGCATDYDAWGNPTSGAATSTVPCVGYRGQVGTNALYYNLARTYDPTVGGFTTTDPAGINPDNPAVANWYAYANNNPIANTDPTGAYAVNDDAAAPVAFRTPSTHGATALPKCPSDFGQLDDFAGPCAIGPSYAESDDNFQYLGHQPLALACSHSQIPTNTRWYANLANIQDGDVNVDCTVLFNRTATGSLHLLMGIEHSRTHVIENVCGVRPIKIGTLEIQIPADLIQDQLDGRLGALRTMGIDVDCVPFLNEANGSLSGNLRKASRHNSCLGFRVRANGVDFDWGGIDAPSGWQPMVVPHGNVRFGSYIVRFRRDWTTVRPGCYD